MVFIYADKKSKLVPIPFLTDEEKALRDDLLSDLDMIKQCRGEFKPSKEFMEVWSPWYIRHEIDLPFDDPRFYAYFSRRPVHVLKLSVIVNASRDGGKVLTKEDFIKAKGFLEEAEKYMQKAFGGAGRAEDADISYDIMQAIQEATAIKSFELHRKFSHDVNREQFSSIIMNLQSMHYVAVENHGDQAVIRWLGV